MTAVPELSIIVVSYNTRDITLNCLRSILKSLTTSPLKYEIIVFDNHSSDDTVTAIKKEFDETEDIRIIKSQDNLGFAKGNNAAVKSSRGRYLLFLNSDIVVLDQAITDLFTYYKQTQASVHFLGGKLLNSDNTPQPSCGPFYSIPVIFAALFLRGDYWGLTRYSPEEPRKVDWVSGACLLTKKEYFESLGGFDEKIFMYMEEIDLLYRAHKKGYASYFYPQARFIHLGSSSSRGRTYPIIQVYTGFLYFYKKHYPQAIFFLRLMLKLKAVTAVFIGRTIRSPYLVNTYEKAYQIASMG